MEEWEELGYESEEEMYEDDIEEEKNGGCYIATAIYGSYNCPEVWVLRRFRDYKLASTWYGRLVIKTYYKVSPAMVRRFGNTSVFKNFWKPLLNRMVTRLQTLGFDNSPYKDKTW